MLSLHTYKSFYVCFSCETQLLLFSHSLHPILDWSSHSDRISFNFAKAVDRVSHKSLIHKLSLLNLDSNLLVWLKYVPSNCSQYVAINDLSGLASQVSFSTNLHTDDCILYCEICETNNEEVRQTNPNSNEIWCETRQIEVNPNFLSKMCCNALCSVNLCQSCLLM